jgi:hypothetical protein
VQWKTPTGDGGVLESRSSSSPVSRSAAVQCASSWTATWAQRMSAELPEDYSLEHAHQNEPMVLYRDNIFTYFCYYIFCSFNEKRINFENLVNLFFFTLR